MAEIFSNRLRFLFIHPVASSFESPAFVYLEVLPSELHGVFYSLRRCGVALDCKTENICLF